MSPFKINVATLESRTDVELGINIVVESSRQCSEVPGTGMMVGNIGEY